MGREVRMVPANWQHPKDEKGRYIPLFAGPYGESGSQWDAEWQQWQLGLCEQGGKYVPIKDEYKHLRYTDYAGARPSPDDYMPDWPREYRTHLMMYEDTSEGTPISPAFTTPEELARWLVDNGASAFGRDTATYEQWLAVAKGGWAPSMVYTPENGLQSGIAAMLG